ncbi:MAG TPA: hypothetical protein IAC41_09645 [Candidatus Merdenecus merdavium]|jgi:hypothetical protein|nr:hypothetical protein [Candidatus Merdenecus merdavium]
MARGRKVSTKTLDEKIEKQQEILAKSKEKYEKDKAEMSHLLKLRNDIRKDELMDAVIKSNKSYDEILAYISDGK